ncbi:serum response factor homolog A-like [Neodiprion virginianus]|uniref:serum response factor homolog A-like n=1 Tax=Neodiprion virginianus TaxID=2961670 RepID=UPI001EE73014|nr:serum response factor homolog A-like [Neodiprion virginianus]
MASGSTNSNSDREDNATGGEGGDDLNKLRLERQQLANQQKELDKSLRDKQQQDAMMAEIRRLTEENDRQRQLVERLSAVEPIQQNQNIERRVEAALAQLDLTYEEREREKPRNSQSYSNNSYNTSEINKPGHINAQPKYQQISQHNGVSTNPNFQNTVPTAVSFCLPNTSYPPPTYFGQNQRSNGYHLPTGNHNNNNSNNQQQNLN